MNAQVLRAIVISTLFLGLGILPASGAQDRGPSTPEERARAVKIAHELEQDPLAGDAKEQRDWVMKWIIAIPDITVNVCFDYFGELPQPPKGHSDDITKQMIISSAAFIIEHPEKSKDEQAVALSGLQGSIKTYEAVLKQDSSARWPIMDKMIRMREQGKLDEYVSDTRRKCSQDQEEPDPDTMHARAKLPSDSGIIPIHRFANSH